MKTPDTQSFRRQPIIIDLVDKAYTELHDFGDKYLKDTVPVEVKVAVGRPAEEIPRVARKEKVELTVMGTHGHTGVRHLVLGSVAEAVTRHAPLSGVHGAHRLRSRTLKDERISASGAG